LLAEHVGAVYDGKIRVPVVDKQGTVIDDEELRRRLYHEYVHVIVRLIADDNVPWWLNEGLAQLFSQEFTEQERQMVLHARDKNALYKLSDLEANQLQTLDADAIRLAYAQSHATVVYMYQRFGKRRLQQLMADLGAGIPTADSMEYRYRRDYATLEREVAAGLDSL